MAKRYRDEGYATDLTEEQWAVLAPLLARRGGPGRPPTVSLRAVVGGSACYLSGPRLLKSGLPS